MAVLALGVNHRTAPLTLRERVSFAPDRLPEALRELRSCPHVSEAAILSTCNRTDLYLDLERPDGAPVTHWFGRYHGLAVEEWQPYRYCHEAEQAVRHVMRVASGLDSLILGEPQILGQVKLAYRTAVQTGTVGQVLTRLFHQAFAVAKQVRTDTAIGARPVSVAFAAVRLARQIFGELSPYTALMIGAGETIELAARHLKANGLARLIIANRTVEGAHRLAGRLGGYAITLEQIGAHLGEVDIVFASTASARPILNAEQIADALARRRRRPVFIADLGVPRDVDPRAGSLEDVYLYTVDDLAGVVDENLLSRREAAEQAEEIIDTKVGSFMGWLGALDSVSTIRSFRANAEDVRNEVLQRARRLHAAGKDPDEALAYLAHTLTNKLLHTPTVRLKRAGAQSRDDLIEAARALFDLDAEPPEST